MNTLHQNIFNLRDWGWEKKETGYSLMFHIKFSPLTNDDLDKNCNWFEGINLKQYKVAKHAPITLKDTLQIYYNNDEFAAHKFEEYFMGHTSGIGFGPSLHSIEIYENAVIFRRAYGDPQNAESDKQLLELFLKFKPSIVMWVIQDEEYGNIWAEGENITSLLNYLKE